MKINIWGARGSIPSPSPETIQYGGNTSCVQVTHKNEFIVLDAGSGIRRLNQTIPANISRIDILLTHLHMDHIMGLGFFKPLYNPNMKINIWGPTSTKASLNARLTRYLSPPLFPVRLNELPCQLQLMEINHSTFEIGSLKIKSAYVCHPGPTVGYRIENENSVLCYLPDHEPILGSANFPKEPEWTSGYDLAKNADLLIHDAQYTKSEYQPRVGWGHSAMKNTLQFAEMTNVKKLLFFHHDPTHTDQELQTLLEKQLAKKSYNFEVKIAAEGDEYILGD